MEYSAGLTSKLFWLQESRKTKTTFDEKWVFERQPIAEKKFGDYFTVLNSVATLKNEVYLFEPEREDDNYYYFKDEKIEKVMAHTAVSPRSRRTNRNYKIIFPYKINEQNVEKIKEEDFQIQYPFTYQYLLKKKKDLQGRTLDKKQRCMNTVEVRHYQV